MKIAFGQKKQMGRQFKEDGTMVPYTVVQILPAKVIQVKTKEKDGYVAAKFAVGTNGKQGKTDAGQSKSAGLSKYNFIKEIRHDSAAAAEVGAELDFSLLEVGATVDIVGWSKGRGFAGVVKRHGFHGHPSSHGHKDQERMPGSISAGGMQHVLKGTRMAGHMGTNKVTIRNLSIVEVDSATKTIKILGAVPGAFNSKVEVVLVKPSSLKFVAGSSAQKIETPVVESSQTETKTDPVTEVAAESVTV